MVGYAEQKAAEARARYAALTRRIQALDVDIGRTLDLLQRQVLRERREELSQERESVVQEMVELPAPPSQDNNEDEMMMERDDLKMLFEVRSDITLLRREVEELRVLITQVRENCAPVPGTLPPALLNVMIISGLIIMAALIVITLRMVA